MYQFSQRALLCAGAAVLAVSIGSSAHAAAFYLQEQSIRGAGRAFSGETADQGAASLWWNPAAIGGMTGGEATLGVSQIMPRGSVDNVGTRIVRPGQLPAAVGGDQRARNPIENGTLPSGAIAYALTPQLSVGLAITSPFSFTTDYDATSWARYTADKTKLRTIDLQPSVAFALTPNFVIGGAINVEHSKATLSNYLPNLSPLLADGHQTLGGSGWDVGYTIGAQYRGGPVSLGVSYKSSVKHKLDGSVAIEGLLGPLAAQNRSVDATADFSTPWQITGGIRFKATDKLTLNGQIVRFGWSKFDAITLGAPLNTAIPEGYRNTWSYAGGVDYAVTPAWTLRGGIQYDETPTQDMERDARVPDSNRWNFSGGTSVALSKSFTIDGAVSYIKFKDVAINRTTAAYAGTAAQTPILVNGRLDNAHAVVLAVGGRFTF